MINNTLIKLKKINIYVEKANQNIFIYRIFVNLII